MKFYSETCGNQICTGPCRRLVNDWTLIEVEREGRGGGSEWRWQTAMKATQLMM